MAEDGRRKGMKGGFRNSEGVDVEIRESGTEDSPQRARRAQRTEDGRQKGTKRRKDGFRNSEGENVEIRESGTEDSPQRARRTQRTEDGRQKGTKRRKGGGEENLELRRSGTEFHHGGHRGGKGGGAEF